MPDQITLYVILIIFLSTILRSAFGFGQGLITLPLLALLHIPITTAVPFMTAISVAIASVIILQDHRHIHFKSVKNLLIASLFGIPVGILLINHVNEHLLKLLLALFVLSFSLYSLFFLSKVHLKKDHPVILNLCGFIAGILSITYGINGPPLVIYGHLRQWSPQHFRATLQAFFLPSSIFALLAFFFSKHWNPEVTHYSLYALPGALIAIPLGRLINQALKGRTFLKFIYALLIAIALTLLFQSLAPAAIPSTSPAPASSATSP